MGYRKKTEGVERVQLVIDPSYWVEIKTCLSRREMGDADQALTKVSVGMGDGEDERSTMSVNPDITAYQNALVTSSVTAWNIDDDDDAPVAVTPANVLEYLKDNDFKAVLRRVTANNKAKTPQEQSKFPGQG